MLRSFAQSRPFSHVSIHRFPRITQTSASRLPSFRDTLASAKPLKSFADAIERPSIRNQVLFVVFGTFGVFAWASQHTHRETEYWVKKVRESGNSLLGRLSEPTNADLRSARYLDLGKRIQTHFERFKESVQSWPTTFRDISIWAYVQAAQPVLDARDGRRLCWTIVAVNTAIWVAWQIPRFKPFMMRSFTHNPLSGKSYTLLTSMFSHKSFIHLVCNSFALTSFGSTAWTYLVHAQAKDPRGLREADGKWHALAFLVSAGLFSGLVSHVISAKWIFPRLVSKLSASAAMSVPISSAARSVGAAAAESPAKTILPSLGASGAIYAAFITTACAFPEAEISLIMPPTYPIPIQWGAGALVTLDMIGIMRGWRFFDHYAHLGGALFGFIYYMYGPQWWNDCRQAAAKAAR